MTLSQEPDAENLDLSELGRKEVFCNINTHFILLKSIVPFLCILMGFYGWTDTAGHDIRDWVFYPLLYLAHIHPWIFQTSMAQRIQVEAIQLFDQHIGSWKFKRHTNREFGTYLFQRKRMRTWLIVGVNLIMIAGVVFLFFLAAIAPNQDFDVIISIVKLVPVFVFMLLFLIVYNAPYPRKGYIYTMGRLYRLRPEGWPSTCVVFSHTCSPNFCVTYWPKTSSTGERRINENYIIWFTFEDRCYTANTSRPDFIHDTASHFIQLHGPLLMRGGVGEQEDTIVALFRERRPITDVIAPNVAIILDDVGHGISRMVTLYYL
ncbi:hypothetical protein PROFUN_01164 [Planoprotostelium fungivorum]|uniref:Uncharacterized protein n=1 Tax=Planoprotostelium fungivorum TaxID=1890364 RepID=A0A2P6NCH6_9EUKA|nr:hypothetical protein PROFUN_01164 [Planoprotostelium fungivorum]